MPQLTIAILAGAGRFPLHVAQAAKRQGARVVALGIQGWVDPDLARHVDAYEDIKIGQLRRVIERLQFHRASQVVLAGKVTKAVVLDPDAGFDADALEVLQQAGGADVPKLVEAIGRTLRLAGLALVDPSPWLQSQVCPEGALTARGPTTAEARDVEVGVRVARALAALDVGQTVVVKRGVVAAVEALEGTDDAIRRARRLAGEGVVVVKTAAAGQDRRMDLPVIGLQTVTTLIEAKATCLAVEAGSTLLLDREALLAAANAAGVCVVGVNVRDS